MALLGVLRFSLGRDSPTHRQSEAATAPLALSLTEAYDLHSASKAPESLSRGDAIVVGCPDRAPP